MRVLSILLATFFSFISICRAQQATEEMRNFTQRDGLPSNEAYTVFRDSRDYLWFATDEGVVRFNGVFMEHFDLPDNIIFKIREDEKGKIWFFSYSGNIYYFSNGKIGSYQYNDRIIKNLKTVMVIDAQVYHDEISVSSNAFKNFFISASGDIRIENWGTDMTYRQSVFAIENIGKGFLSRKLEDNTAFVQPYIKVKLKTAKGERKYTLPYGERPQPQTGTIADGDTYYFYQGHFLYKLLPDGSFQYRQFKNDILSLTQPDANHVLAGVYKTGAFLVDKDFTNTEDRVFLKDLSVSGSAKDHENGIWFSTLEKGIFYFPSGLINVFPMQQFSKKPVYRICNIDDSSFLFVTTEGVFKYTSNIITAVFPVIIGAVYDLQIQNRKILLAAFFRPDEVFPALCFAKSYRVHDPLFDTFFYFQSSTRLIKERENVYLGSQSTAMYELDLSKPLSKAETGNFYRVQKMIYAIKGVMVKGTGDEVWIGNYNSFVAVNYKTGAVRDFGKADTLFKRGLTDKVIFSNGISAVSTRFNGLVLMKDTAVIAHIDKTNGLTNNSVKCMVADGNRLWVATLKTITVISFNSFEPVKYTVHHIERNEEFLNMVIYQLCIHGNKIMAATSNGIYTIDRNISEEISQDKSLPFYINSVSTYRGDTSAIESISLPFSKNRITVGFNAVCFDSPGDVKYYYRAVNNDTAWQYINGTTLTMDNLSPGNYKLQLKAEIPEQKRFSQIRSLNITIQKPWWQNNLLRLGLLLLFLLIVFYVFRMRVKREKNKAKQKVQMQTQLLELEHKALRSQMNPHFIFNCLTSIQHLIIKEEGVTANDYLVKFARLIRFTLEISKEPYISLENEAAYIADYVKLEKLRFGNLFEFKMTVDENINTKEVFIPNMMIQPVVENSIRHGMKNMVAAAGLIEVLFSRTKDTIVCTIRDNGRGREPEKSDDKFRTHKSFGIEIINNRLEIFNAGSEKKYFIVINDLRNASGQPRGTEVILHLPLKTNSFDQGHTY